MDQSSRDQLPSQVLPSGVGLVAMSSLIAGCHHTAHEALLETFLGMVFHYMQMFVLLVLILLMAFWLCVMASLVKQLNDPYLLRSAVSHGQLFWRVRVRGQRNGGGGWKREQGTRESLSQRITWASRNRYRSGTNFMYDIILMFCVFSVVTSVVVYHFCFSSVLLIVCRKKKLYVHSCHSC